MILKKSLSLLPKQLTLIFASLQIFPGVSGQTLPGNNSGVWDLSHIYKNEADWFTERDAILAGMKQMEVLQKKNIANAKDLGKAMDVISQLRARAARLVVYSVLVFETNNKSEKAFEKYNISNALEASVEGSVAFIRSTIAGIHKATLENWLNNEPTLQRHRRRINRILLEMPYSLSPNEQKITESFSAFPRTYGDIYDRIMQSNTSWPILISSAGDSVNVNLNTLLDMRKTGEAREKNKIEQAFFESADRFSDVLGLLYTNRIYADLIISRQRNFTDGIEAIWKLRDGISPQAYMTMLDVMRSNTSTLQRYARLRITALGLKDLTYANFMSAPPRVKSKISVDSALKITLAALQPVGTKYISILEKYLHNPDWMHLEPLENKNPTYAIFPAVGGIPSYFMQTYRGSYSNARSFTGAVALAVAFNNIPRENKPDTRDDPGVYSNGIIYAGRLLFDDFMLKQKDSKEEHIAKLLSSLELLWGFYKTGLIMELDVKVQDEIKNNRMPSGREISKIYYDYLRKYYGGENGLMIDNYFQHDWITEPVTFSTYEHQFWCAAIAVACSLEKKIVEGDIDAQKCMYEVLGRNDVELSYQLFLKANIDLTKKETYESVIIRMNSLLDELEKQLQ